MDTPISSSLPTKFTDYLAFFIAFTAVVIFYPLSKLLSEIQNREDVTERAQRLDIALKSSNQAELSLNSQLDTSRMMLRLSISGLHSPC